MFNPIRLFSFSDWNRNHPADQPPGDRLDDTFDNAAKAIQDVADNLGQLRRSDGALQNHIVTRDSLDPTLTAVLVSEVKQSIAPDVEAVQSLASGVSSAQIFVARETEKATLAALAATEKAKFIEDRLPALLNTVGRSTDTAHELLRRVETRAADVVNDANDSQYWGNYSYSWGVVSYRWAEYMDGPIPADVLATMGISGDHWSSRWWATRAASAFGMLAWWYQGAWPQPGPPSTPNTPTGQPLPPGAVYWDTTLNCMMVWNGSTWVNMASPQKGVTASLYYLASAGQTVFPLSVVDRHGKNFVFNQTLPEGIAVGVNGVRLEPTFDFSVDIVGSSVTFLRALTLNALVTFDLLTPASQLTPSGTVNTVLLTPIVPDGVKTAFTGLTVASNGHAVNVAKNEELQVSVNGVIQQPGAAYSATGASITFTTAPEADANLFIIWFGPTNP